MVQGIEENAEAEGVYLPNLFMNDASWDQEVIPHFGAENLAELKKIQIQYDARHVFQRFKLLRPLLLVPSQACKSFSIPSQVMLPSTT